MAEFQADHAEINQSNSDHAGEENPSNALTLSMMAAEIDEEQQLLYQTKHQTLGNYLVTSNRNPFRGPQTSKKLTKTEIKEPTENVFQFRVPIDEDFKNSQPSKTNYQVNINYHQPTSPQNQSPSISNQKKIPEINTEKQQQKEPQRTFLIPMNPNQDQPKGNQQKKIGGRVITSRIVRPAQSNNESIGAIDEQSQVLPENNDEASMSHFVPACFDQSEEQEALAFQQQKPNQNNILIKISSQSKKQNKEFQQNKINSDSPIKVREDIPIASNHQNQRQSPPAQFNNQYMFQMPYQHYQGSNHQMKIKPHENNSREPQFLPTKLAQPLRQQPILRQKNQRLEKKNSIVQVTKGMMSSYGPINVKPQIQGVYNGGKFSQDGKRLFKTNKSIDKQKYLQNFQRSQGIEQKKQEEQKMRYQQAIINKLKKIQQAIVTISDNPAVQESQHKIEKNNFRNNQPNYNSKPSKHQIQNMQRFVPQQLINSLSSVDEKDPRAVPNPRNNQQNINISEELRKLKLKIRQLQSMKSIHLHQDLKQEPVLTGNQYMPKKTRHFSVNYKDYNQAPALKVYNRKNIKHQFSDEKSISDDDFLELERLITIFKSPPQPTDSPEQVTELGLSAFKIFGVEPENFTSMDLSRYKTSVRFYLERGPTIIWQYNGELYFGETERKGVKVFDRQGQGYLITPNKEVYKGMFSKNKRNGFGVSYNIKGQKYKGYWKNDLFNDRGKLVTLLSRYDGDFQKGLKSGLGFQIFVNGDVYDGNYLEDKFQGIGKYIWKNKTSYEGQFKKGYMDGEGIWKSYKGDSYEGQYYKNMKHGYGIYRWSNGGIYEGKFQHGHRVANHCNIKTTISVEKEITYDMGSNEDSEQYEVRMDGNNAQKDTQRFIIRRLQESIDERRSPLKAFIVKK